ncbi:MAG TPA: lipoprotein LpqV [Mycobacterium sp.]|nr:lipoprotein LpqV [Mycobacterium sp.]
MSVAILSVGSAASSGCSPGRHGGTAATSSAATSGAPGNPSAPPTGPSRANATGVSPGGVTTRVDAPADSSEEEYGQACRAAKLWMDQRGGDRRQLVEPYLATLQAPGVAPGPGTFNTPWVQLTAPRQAAVIVAVRAAAANECG